MFDGQTILITGATGNLGRALAGAFGARGALLALIGHSEASLERGFPGEASGRLTVAVDLLDADAVQAAVSRIERDLGPIHAVCAAAGGFAMGTPIHETPAENWQRMMDLNVTTLLNVAHAVVPGMITRGTGRIVTVGATGALKGAAGMGAYSASKSAVLRITETMAAELRTKGINVNCVLPSVIDTPENRAAMPKADPAKWVKPEKIAEVMAFLCSNEASAIHGALVPVTGLS